MSRRFETAAGPTQRQLRAGELVRHALVEVLAHEELRDPDLQGVSVTLSEVRCSPDLKHATVFCAPLGKGDKETVAKALNRASAFLRGRLAKHVELKFTPNLRFLPDPSYDEADLITALLRRAEVARDLQGGDDDTERGVGEPDRG